MRNPLHSTGGQTYLLHLEVSIFTLLVIDNHSSISLTFCCRHQFPHYLSSICSIICHSSPSSFSLTCHTSPSSPSSFVVLIHSLVSSIILSSQFFYFQQVVLLCSHRVYSCVRACSHVGSTGVVKPGDGEAKRHIFTKQCQHSDRRISQDRVMSLREPDEEDDDFCVVFFNKCLFFVNEVGAVVLRLLLTTMLLLRIAA